MIFASFCLMKGIFLFSFYRNLKTTSSVNDLVFIYHLSGIVCFSTEEAQRKKRRGRRVTQEELWKKLSEGSSGMLSVFHYHLPFLLGSQKSCILTHESAFILRFNCSEFFATGCGIAYEFSIARIIECCIAFIIYHLSTISSNAFIIPGKRLKLLS